MNSPEKQNILLIAASWAWKSTKWKELAKKIWYDFIDFDNYILEKITQQTAINIYNILWEPSSFNPYQLINTSVADILKLVWDETFLEIENYLAKNLIIEKPTVIATSWSLPTAWDAMKHLMKNWTSVYIETPLASIA